MAGGEERPVVGGVALEEGDFSQDEQNCFIFLSAAGFEMGAQNK